jgi:hypothetical protein
MTSNNQTRLPKSARKDANSQPIAPAPMIATRSGRSSQANAWSELTMRRPSI